MEKKATYSVYVHMAQAGEDVRLGRVSELNAACGDILAELDEREQ